MKPTRAWLVPAALGALALGGCCGHERRSSYLALSPAPCPSCGVAGVRPPVLVPIPAPMPPGPPAQIERPVPLPPAPETPPPGPAARLLPPDLPPSEPKDDVRLSPPPPAPPAPEKPAPKAEEADAPLDIQGFTTVRPKLATGQRPFPDGFDWLRSRGYKAVLHVRRPGDDDLTDKRRADAKGLTYLSLDASANTLTWAVVREFSRLVTDPANLPLYVYPRDSAVLGGLWYLHFRDREKLSDEQARREAVRLGLRTDADGEHRTVWVAIQALLASPPP